MKSLNINKDLITPNQSFWIGVGSIWNIAGNYYKFHIPSYRWQSDVDAIASDWAAVGNDIKVAINKFENEQ
jgi:hypothetical protein